MDKEELQLLTIGIRMQLDECDKLTRNYDPIISKHADEKKKQLIDLWGKLEQMEISLNK